MADECYGDMRQSSVMAFQYPTTIGHLDHLKDTSDDRKELKSYPQIGFSKGIQMNSDLMASSFSGIKRQSHHQSKHHQRTLNNHHKRNNHERKSEQKRFCRTASALKQAGLLELTLQTAQLVQENEKLQNEIDSLQEQTIQFSKALQGQLEEKLKNAKNSV